MRILAWPASSPSHGNPYTSLIYGEFGKNGHLVEGHLPWAGAIPAADVFHVHWPEAFLWGRAARIPLATRWAGARALKAMDLVRGRGGVVVWTVHNIEPHGFASRDHERAWNLFFPKFRERIDALIGLTSRSLDLVCDAYPELQFCSRAVVPHPHYRSSYPAPPFRTDARTTIGLPHDRFIVGMIGRVRRSKRIPRAIEAFRIARRLDELLLISGHCPDAVVAGEIKTAIGGDPNVVFDGTDLTDAELVRRFAAVDVALINQASTLNSGTLLMALSMDRPAIAPASASVVELAETIGPDWVAPFSGELAPDSLRRGLDVIRRGGRDGSAPLDRFDPAMVSRTTIVALAEALERRRAAARRLVA
jgi:beta-1,4-mannosyltransferase